MTAAPFAPPARPPARWVLRPPPDAAAVRHLAAALSLPEPLCAVLVGRGIAEPEAAKRYLRPRLEHLAPPQAFHDMDAAVARLVRALDAGERILVHGDYDVDGMCATTLLVSVLSALGGHATPFIPNRLTDGYDLGPAGVAAARAHGATLMVTCDCGTSALQAIADSRASGIDVIVTDHHLAGGALPACEAVLNPKRPDQTADGDLVAVGVAFHLARALCAARGADERHALRHLDLVALATVADVGALRGENRILVRRGLEVLQETTRPGLVALLESSGLARQPLTAGRVAFTLAPRLNAAGRLKDALLGVELLRTKDAAAARDMAHALELLNRERQQLDQATLDEARRQVATLGLGGASGLVLAAQGWHPGVVGIVASRIVEEFGVPAVLVALDGEMGKGSGRSVGQFDLHGALTACAPHLVRYGGHRAAAGVTVAADRVPAFREAFEAVARERLTDDDRVAELRLDLEVPLADVTDAFEKYLRYGEPWGVANPTPVFLARGVTLAQPPRVMKDVHVRLTVADGPHELPAIGWRLASQAQGLGRGDRVDLAYQIERDTWQGADRLQLKLVGLRRSA